MKPITNRNELRWALEDLGDDGLPILQYLQGFFEYSDALAHTARITVAELKDESTYCWQKFNEQADTDPNNDWDATSANLKTWAEDLEYVIKEYEQC